MKTPQKKQKVQYGLQPKSFAKNKQWMVDQDYTKQLSKEEAEWLNRFNQEYYRNTFESSEKDLHNTPELKKQCYNNENARNRDLYGIGYEFGYMVGSNTVNDGEGNEIDALDMIADYDIGIVQFEQEYDKQALKKRK